MKKSKKRVTVKFEHNEKDVVVKIILTTTWIGLQRTKRVYTTDDVKIFYGTKYGFKQVISYAKWLADVFGERVEDVTLY